MLAADGGKQTPEGRLQKEFAGLRDLCWFWSVCTRRSWRCGCGGNGREYAQRFACGWRWASCVALTLLAAVRNFAGDTGGERAAAPGYLTHEKSKRPGLANPGACGP